MNATFHPTRNWLGAALSLIYPEGCQICRQRRATAREGFVCAQCWTQVRFIRPPFCERCGLPYAGELNTPFECSNCREMEFDFRHARAAVVAKTVVLEAIHRFKYSRALWFEEFLAGLLVREAAPQLRAQEWDYIVPVPLHPLKKREREFNQAEVLARHLSSAHRHPNPAFQREAGFKHAGSVCDRREVTAGKEANHNSGRHFHHRCDHQRLRASLAAGGSD